MSAKHDLNATAGEDAIRWMLEVRSGEFDAEQAQRFKAWLGQHPDNLRAWNRLELGLAPCNVASRRPVAQALLENRMQRLTTRRKVLRGLAGAVGIVTTGTTVADRFVPLDQLFAQKVTRTAELKRLALPDGSSLLMGPRSALDVGVSRVPRSAVLRTGRVMAEIAGNQEPFTVLTGSMRLDIVQGRFVIARGADFVSATAVEGSAELVLDGVDVRPLPHGRTIRRQGGRTLVEEADLEVVTSWAEDMLVVKDQALSSIVEELRLYFPGVIRFAPDVGRMRVTGVFKLNDPTRALEALAATLNLEAAQVGGYWLTLRRKEA